MPREIVTGAGLVVIVAAAAGLYLGVSRSVTPVAGEETGLIAPTTPIANAKPIVAQTPTLDEATVRRLAREEAQTLIAARAAPKKPVVSADDDDDSDTSGANPNTPTVPLVQAKPATPLPTPQ